MHKDWGRGRDKRGPGSSYLWISRQLMSQAIMFSPLLWRSVQPRTAGSPSPAPEGRAAHVPPRLPVASQRPASSCPRACCPQLPTSDQGTDWTWNRGMGSYPGALKSVWWSLLGKHPVREPVHFVENAVLEQREWSKQEEVGLFPVNRRKSGCIFQSWK